MGDETKLEALCDLVPSSATVTQVCVLLPTLVVLSISSSPHYPFFSPTHTSPRRLDCTPRSHTIVT